MEYIFIFNNIIYSEIQDIREYISLYTKPHGRKSEKKIPLADTHNPKIIPTFVATIRKACQDILDML